MRPLSCTAAALALGVSTLAAQEANVRTDQDVTLHDASRKRDLPIRVYIPAGTARAPVIIFSHGAGGAKIDYSYLGGYWADHGYISIHPSHPESDASIRQPGRPVRMLWAVRDVTESPQIWQDRARDISFLIDSLNELERRVPLLAGRLDSSRIGVAGHSEGAQTTALIAGASVTIDNLTRSFVDRRPRAFIMLSPPGPGRMGVTDRSLSSVARPTMIMTGSQDGTLGRETPEWRLQTFRALPSGDKYTVFIKGASHFTFVGQKPWLGSTEGLTIIQTLTAAFWDAYVRDGRTSVNALTSVPAGVRVQHK